MLRRCSGTVVVVFGTLVIFVANPSVAFGQVTNTTTAPVTTTTTTTTVPTGSDLSNDRILAATVALVVGLLLVIVVLAFLSMDRKRTTDLLGNLGVEGVSIVVVSEEAVSTGQAVAIKAPELRIKGQSPIEVGKPAEFTVTGRDEATGEDQPVVAEWGTSNVDVSGVVDTTDTHLTLTPVKVGQFTLTVKATGYTDNALTVTVVPALPATSVQVSFLGSGWGTIVLGLSVASITAALGLTQVITGETVGVILGAIVGYSAAQLHGQGGSVAGGQSGGTPGGTPPGTGP